MHNYIFRNFHTLIIVFIIIYLNANVVYIIESLTGHKYLFLYQKYKA